MNNQSASEIIDRWESHGLQNLHEINLDRIYAFPLTRNDLDIRDNSVQWHLDHYGISRQRLVETKDEQVKSLMVDIEHQIRELSERTWKRPLHNSSFHEYPLFYSMKTVVNFPKITNSGIMQKSLHFLSEDDCLCN